MPEGKKGFVYTWTGSRVLEATGGTLLSGSTRRRFSGVSTDSRHIASGQLFVALVGERFDGHRFAAQAVEKGASGVLVERRFVRRLPLQRFRDQGIFCVSAPDTTRALGALAAHHRRRWNGKVAAITGSNGKTTTRKMTAEVIRQKFSTLSTLGNYNNEIGVPMTLLNLSPEHQWAVVELGMNHPGEIGRLAAICSPNIGLITNIAPAHLEGVGSVEGVAAAKAELLDHIPKDGVAVLNADDPRVLELTGRAACRVLFYGSRKSVAIRATAVREARQSVRFDLHVAGTRIPVRLPTPGRFMMSNALGAAAVGFLAGLSPDRIRDGLEAFVPEKGRMAVTMLAGRIGLIDDTYNANPGSMKAAIDTLMRLKGKKGRGILVLGDMLELGIHSEALHRRIGAHAGDAGAHRLYAAGRFAPAVAAGAVAAGMPEETVFTGAKDAVAADLFPRLKPGDWVLVKGSRGMAMETVVQALKTWTQKDGAGYENSPAERKKAE